MEVGRGAGHIVLDEDPAPLPKKRQSPLPVFGPFLLWPNGWMHEDATYGWMHEDATWHVGRPQPRRLCVRWGPSTLPKKGAEPPFFGPCVLWPNGSMYQDITWYGNRPQPRRHCVRWGPSSPPLKGHSPQFSANVLCGQTAGWIKMPLGMEVGLGPDDFVLNADPVCSRKKGTAPHPIFGPCLLWPNGWMVQDATWYRGKPRPRRRCVAAPPKKGTASQFSVHVYCG